jgi:hypothetical protein
MTVVQNSDYLSPRKIPLRKRPCPRDRLHGGDWGLGSRLLIACGMISATVVVFIVVAGVASYAG